MTRGFWWVRQLLADPLPEGERITPLAARTLTLPQYLRLVYLAGELASDTEMSFFHDGYLLLNLDTTLLIATPEEVVYVSYN